jgi:hypothetical protein
MRQYPSRAQCQKQRCPQNEPLRQRRRGDYYCDKRKQNQGRRAKCDDLVQPCVRRCCLLRERPGFVVRASLAPYRAWVAQYFARSALSAFNLARRNAHCCAGVTARYCCSRNLVPSQARLCCSHKLGTIARFERRLLRTACDDRVRLGPQTRARLRRENRLVLMFAELMTSPCAVEKLIFTSSFERGLSWCRVFCLDVLRILVFQAHTVDFRPCSSSNYSYNGAQEACEDVA